MTRARSTGRSAQRLPGMEALDFRSLVERGDVVTWLGGVAEPVALVSHLGSQAAECPPFSVMVGLGLTEAMPAGLAHVGVKALGGAGTNRRFFADGAGGVLPCNLSNLCDMIERSDIKVDVVLLQVAGPDRKGRYNAGFSIQYLREAFQRARLVVAQVNSNVPWTMGDTLLEADCFDVVIPADTPVLQVPAASPGPADIEIVHHIHRLVGDRSVIQVAIGGIPDAAMRALADRRGLGIHSGILGDGLMGLIESGAADNRHKAIDPGVTVTMALHGTDKLNRFAAHNKRVSVRSPRYTHDPSVLAQLERLVAINSAIEVDLTGQINAETAQGRHIGMVGGQVDFVRAAMRTRDGRSIIALPATARGGTISRIVPRLKDGVVTTPRADADIVVTEHGIAELRGCTLEERAKAMAAVASPDFREPLLSAAAAVL